MKNKKYYILSFLIPLISMILLYMSVGVINGNKNILTVDLKNQYIEFFSGLKNVLAGTISPFYSFSKTLGGNFFGLITYYLMSPFNLMVILFDKIDLPKFILIINILKIAAAGLTSFIYFNKTFKKDKISLTFSIIYSLMAYNIVYSQNIMWLDGVILLPVIFIGIDRLLEKKPTLFYVSLTLNIICNYYIGYMSCIASLIYFIYQSYLKEKQINKKEIIECIKYILISVLTSGIILIPSIMLLLQGKANGMLGEFVPNQKFAILDIISRFYIGTFKESDLLGKLPNIYISLIAIVLVIYYFYNKKITKTEKKAASFLILAFGIGFVFSPINTIWHTLKNPVGFPFRYSFMFDFILLVIAYKSITKIDKIDDNFIKKFILYATIITLVIDKVLYTSTMYYKALGTLLLMIIYIMYLKNKKSKTISNLIILLVTAEMLTNGFSIVYNIKYQNKEIYNDFIKETGPIIEEINKKEKNFFRLEKDYSYSSNDELLLNYNGISHFSSTYEEKTNELLGKYLGIFNRFYVTNYNGSTLVTNSLFNIKYLLSKKDLEYYKKIETKNNINEYINNYNLPLGFMVDDRITKLELIENEPFINQNSILKNMDCNIQNVFYKNNFEYELKNVEYDKYEKQYKIINENYTGTIKITITNNTQGILYGYIYANKDNKIDLLVNGKSIIDINDENGYNYNVFELGNKNIGDQIELEIVLLKNKLEIKNIGFYTLDLNKFDNAINILNNKSSMNIKKYKTDYIKANINVKEENQILYTSIPFDKGFTILVDNKKIQPEKIFDTLTAIKLEKGQHEIIFKYTPSGLKLGIIISLIGIALFTIKKKKV